jgi:uncharacterized protein YjbI with pentapeptide repeats
MSVARITRANLTSALIEDANLSNLRIANANLSLFTVEDCQLAGMRINGVLVTDMLAVFEAQMAKGRGG